MPPAAGTRVDSRWTLNRWAPAAGVVAAVFLTRWPFRSHTLFNWDSANFALAIARIDIAQHRPHPPGYLGYVLIARAIAFVVHDANTAMVLWNIATTAIAALVIGRFAWECAGREHRALAASAAIAIVITSPAVWFYGEIADISASELLFALLVAYAAWRAARGEDRAMRWCVAALVVAASFKVVTAILMTPVAIVAWTRVSPRVRRRTGLWVSIALVAGAVTWLVVQPGLPSVIWTTARSSHWLFRGDLDRPMVMFNRNLRDTLMAAIVGLGAVNAVAALWWIARDRRLPAGLDRGFAIAWLVPGLLVFLFVMIARPGYLMPLVPLGVLVVAGFYSRLQPGLAIALITAQALVNVAHFTRLTPAVLETVSGQAPYRAKTVVQRMAADLAGLSATTAFSIDQSDRRMQSLLDLVAASCPGGAPVIVAGVDWRRVMVYLPEATAIDVVGGEVLGIARHTDASPLAQGGVELHTSCPVIWLGSVDGAEGVSRPADVIETVPHVGWLTAPGTLRVTRAGVVTIR